MTDIRRKENDWKKLRDHELMEVFTHTDTHMHIKKHMWTHTHKAPPLLSILIYGCPYYTVPPTPESSSHWPASACAALLPKLILHDPFTLFLKLSLVYKQVVGVNLPLSVRNICVY